MSHDGKYRKEGYEHDERNDDPGLYKHRDNCRCRHLGVALTRLMRCEALQLRFRKEGHGHDERARNTGNLDFHIHRSHDINYVFDCRRASHASLSAGVHGENNSRSATMRPVEKLTVEGFIRVRHNDTTMKRVRHEWAVSRRWGLREVPIRSNRFLDSGSREQQIYRSLEWFIRARQYDTRLISARHARSAVVKRLLKVSIRHLNSILG
jgi:hypothetical protein